jgi:hypothetical protein
MRPACLASICIAALVLAACGGSGGGAHTAHTVTFSTAGAFPTATIVGHYSASGCSRDADVVFHDARLFYTHSTSAPGPADLYFYNMRFAYAHFQADGCSPAQLGDRMTRDLSAAQRTWLLANLPSDFRHIFAVARAAA